MNVYCVQGAIITDPESVEYVIIAQTIEAHRGEREG